MLLLSLMIVGHLAQAPQRQSPNTTLIARQSAMKGRGGRTVLPMMTPRPPARFGPYGGWQEYGGWQGGQFTTATLGPGQQGSTTRDSTVRGTRQYAELYSDAELETQELVELRQQEVTVT